MHFYKLLLGLLFLNIFSSNAQSIKPQSLNAGGQSVSQSNGSLSYVIGETVILTYVDSSGNTIGQGFTSAAAGSVNVLAIENPNSNILELKLYPNPSTDLLFVEIGQSSLDLVQIDLVGIDGKIHFSERYAAQHNKIGINTQKLLPGAYILSLKNRDGQPIGIYKIIKQ